MEIHKLLKNRRKKLKISQDKLARFIGFEHRSTVSRLEDGKIEWKFRSVLKACELLKLEIKIKEK
jgi:predicted transcriptional regulator